ncbi:L,D-transpeptidase family protein [Methylophaga sp. OBS3]|uniref:L,D-transpeptidase family protein n=1 Tax=Methylophaga sp. OBS3 TaxID=2991934 RepID=UPI0022502ABB|nr:L,D-transpeptidase family protein [Methylophaga sp. OBS3]MCX4190046.1 L,D-transpeptidase family protein [Methylophaga sp. OBS3]
MIKRVIAVLIAGAVSIPAQSAVFEIPDEQTQVVGQNIVVYTNKEDTLLDIARNFDLGYGDIVNANPDIDAWVPGDNKRIIVPTRFVLPDAPREGIVINIPEMRLYYYPKAVSGQPQQVVTHPIGIGREGRDTPFGKFSIIQKRENPTWTPPESIRKEHAAEGDILPAVVPAGPNNPLGTRAMRLSNPSYLIHGTHRPYGVGLRVSSGCIRLFPEDIESLYSKVPMNTSVNIIYSPFKAGMQNNALYIESHKQLDDLDKGDADAYNMTPIIQAMLAVTDKLPEGDVWTKADNVLLDSNGVVHSLSGEEAPIVEDIWFIHGGTGQKVPAKMHSAIKQLQIENLFWPVRGGTVGEIVLGPFESREQADDMAARVSEAAGTPVWTVQLPDTML